MDLSLFTKARWEAERRRAAQVDLVFTKPPPSGEKLVMSWDPVDPIVDLGTFHPLRDLATPFMKHSEAQD